MTSFTERYPNFTISEFSEDPERFADRRILISLQYARHTLGVEIYPSPSPGALARFDDASKGSQHYCNPEKGIYANAIDFFVAGNPVSAFFGLTASYAFRRIGVYFDTTFAGQPWVMFHGDNNYVSDTRLWYRDKGKYAYPKYGTEGYAGFLALLQSRVTDFNQK